MFSHYSSFPVKHNNINNNNNVNVNIQFGTIYHGPILTTGKRILRNIIKIYDSCRSLFS